MPKHKKTITSELHRRHIYFSRINLVIITLIFAVIGAIILINSLAAPNPNLPGDLNNDNKVDALDLSLLLTNFGTTNSAADINGDGHVDVLDLSALLTHYGQTLSTSLTFESVTSWARPSPATPSAATAAGWRLVPFTTKAGLDSAIANMQPHDYIYYNGTGVLDISSSSGNAYSIGNHNPSSPVVIDFGASHDLWDTTKVSSNYVHFSFTGTAIGWDCLYIHDSSNLHIFGGDMGSNMYGGGIRIMGYTHDVTFWDFYVHNIGGSGVGIQPINPSTGASESIQNLNVRGEVNRFALNPSLDPHADKGSGEHGVIIHGNSGHYDNSSVAVYAHDSLRPGEVSVGQTWPEGGGGSALEPGTDATGGATSQDNDKYYVKGNNLLMIPNGTNPGSTAQQTGGNVIDAWGSVPLNGNDFVWIEGNNDTGAVMHGAGGGWYNANPAILVEHGRHNNTNQTTVGQSQNVPYYQGLGIIYQDIQ